MANISEQQKRRGPAVSEFLARVCPDRGPDEDPGIALTVA
jgi:hypothetical protein